MHHCRFFKKKNAGRAPAWILQYFVLLLHIYLISLDVNEPV